MWPARSAADTQHRSLDQGADVPGKRVAAVTAFCALAAGGAGIGHVVASGGDSDEARCPAGIGVDPAGKEICRDKFSHNGVLITQAEFDRLAATGTGGVTFLGDTAYLHDSEAAVDAWDAAHLRSTTSR